MVIFAAGAGVMAWQADKASDDTESKKYKGLYAGSIVSGILFVVSLMYFIYSVITAGSSPTVEEAAGPVESEIAPEAIKKLGEADAILGAAPNKKSIIKMALEGNANGAQRAAAERGTAAALAKASASSAAEEAARVAEQAAATKSTTSENAVRAAEAAAAKAAQSNAATKAAQSLAARAAAAEAAGKTTTAAAVNASARAKATEAAAEAAAKEAGRLGTVAGIAR